MTAAEFHQWIQFMSGFILTGALLGAVATLVIGAFAKSIGNSSEGAGHRARATTAWLSLLLAALLSLPLLAPEDPAHEMCGTEAFFKITPPFFLGGACLGSFSAWFIC